MAASRGLRVLALAALARGEPAASDGQAACRSTLAGLRTRAKFEVAALCRASLPTDICKQAMQELGPAPWSSESMHSACSRWESEWAPAMHMKGRSLESVVMDNVTGTKAPTPVPTPWQAPLPGINAFTVPGLALPTVQPPPAKATVLASDTKKFPESMPPEAVVGSLKMMVSEIVPVPHDLPFQSTVVKQVAQLAGVDLSKLQVTSVELLPEPNDLGVPKISGEVQVFFAITGENKTDAAKIAKKLQSANKKVLSYQIWQDMTAAGSNQHSLLIESLDARSASDDEEQSKNIASATADLAENVTGEAAAKVGKAKEQAKNTKNATAELADNVTDARTAKVGKAKEQAKTIKNTTAELAENVTDATAAKVSKDKDQLVDAVKGFGSLLGKKPKMLTTGKATEVLDDAEVQGGSVAKDGVQSATASWANMLLGAAAVCSMAVFVAGKLRRRRAVSQRTVTSRGSGSAYGYDDCEGLE